MKTPVETEEKMVKIGSKIVVRLENGTELTVKVGYAHKQKPEEIIISWLSPLGKAVLGKKSGDTAVYTVGNNTKRVYIEKIIDEN